jgi:hypothetical protein
METEEMQGETQKTIATEKCFFLLVLLSLLSHPFAAKG